MRLIVKLLLCAGSAITLSTGLEAQQQSAAAPWRPEFDIAITYSTPRSNLLGGGSFWQQGGSIDAVATDNHGFGLALNVTGTHASNISSSGVDLTVITTTFGPRYTWSHPLPHRSQKRLDIFGQTLIGEAHGTDSVFPSSAGAQSTADVFALQIGGGVNFGLSRHLAIRPLQADWLRTQFPNGGNNAQNNLRLGAGVVYRIPSKE